MQKATNNKITRLAGMVVKTASVDENLRDQIKQMRAENLLVAETTLMDPQ